MSDTAKAADTMVDRALQMRYAALEKKFDAFAVDVHLPFLDAALYKKYFVAKQSEQRADHFQQIIEAVHTHRVLTLHILRSCHEREELVRQLHQCARDFSAKKLSTLEAQTQSLRLLWSHRQITLNVVEGIQKWRRRLTRPFPFQFQNKNYLLKVLEDCDAIDSGGLKLVLPLRIAQYPLCSNVASLQLFSPDNQAKAAGEGSAAVAAKSQPDAPARLRAAESVLFEERSLQQRILGELASLARDGKFVTVLNTPNIVPNCSTGIPVSNVQWQRALQTAVEESLTKITGTTPMSLVNEVSPLSRATEHDVKEITRERPPSATAVHPSETSTGPSSPCSSRPSQSSSARTTPRHPAVIDEQPLAGRMEGAASDRNEEYPVPAPPPRTVSAGTVEAPMSTAHDGESDTAPHNEAPETLPSNELKTTTTTTPREPEEVVAAKSPPREPEEVVAAKSPPCAAARSSPKQTPGDAYNDDEFEEV